MNNEICKNCWWWKEWLQNNAIEGECRKKSPVLTFSQEDGNSGTAWPDTKHDDFCGEFDATK